MTTCLLSLLILIFSAFSAPAQTPMGKFLTTARQFEIKPMKDRPAWASRPDRDLFRIAWITDQHFVHAESVRVNRICLNQIRDEIRPNAVIITGDNCGLDEELLPRLTTGKESLGLRRQKFLKDTLDRELALPYFIIPGDNWPDSFNRVFGSDQYSFNLGGFHFVFFSADYQAQKEGCVSFRDSSIRWLINDLKQNQNRPCLYFSHEPVYPQVFVDAPKINDIFKKNPQVIAAVCGHLHLDLEFRRKHWTQWIGPSVGRSHRPGFKLMHFQKKAVVMDSFEWNPEKRKFLQARKWQKIDIPIQLQDSIADAPLSGLKTEDYSSLPPHGRENRPELIENLPQLSAARMAFIIEFGLSAFFKK